MSLYVKQLRSNVKKPIDITLGARTLIIGPNGSGKSAILNSIELAFGGFVTDFLGKTVKLQKEVYKLASEENLSVQCTFSNDEVRTFSMKKTARGSISKPKAQGPNPLTLPMKEVSEMLSGSGAKLKEWLMLQTISELSVPQLMEICQRYKLKPQDATVESFLELLDQTLLGIKDQVKEASDKVKIRKSTVDNFEKNINPNVDTAVKGKIKEAERALDLWNYEGQIAKNKLKQISQTETEIEKLKSGLLENQNYLELLNPHMDKLATEEEYEIYLESKRSLPLFQLLSNIDTKDCFFCGSKHADYTCKIEEIENPPTAIKLRARYLEIKSIIGTIQNTMESLETELSSNKEYVADYEKKSIVTSEEEYLEWNEKLKKLREKRQDLSIYHLKLQELFRIKSELKKMEDDLSEVKQKQKSLLSIQTDILQNAKDNFIKSINESLSFEIELEITSLGIDFLKKDKELSYKGLSGVEFMELKFAICRYLHPENSLILGEDKAIDPRNLTNLMEKLSTFSGQVILTSTVPPSTLLSDWTIVTL